MRISDLERAQGRILRIFSLLRDINHYNGDDSKVEARMFFVAVVLHHCFHSPGTAILCQGWKIPSQAFAI